MMSQYRIQNQIAVYKTNKKLVEFNDKLKAAPVEYYGHIHAQGEKLNDGSRPRSCIGMILQDYSKGTGGIRSGSWPICLRSFSPTRSAV